MRKIYIKTYGCQMNIYDSMKIKTLLLKNKYNIVKDREEADVVIINTCHIRKKATEKIYSEAGKFKRKILIITGCTAQAEGEEMIKRIPYIDMIIGPQSYNKLPELIRAFNNKKWIIDLNLRSREKFKIFNIEQEKKYSSFVTIQEGCDKFCNFCCVPYTRGREYSRDIESIYREVKYLSKSGIKEIILLGQNVSAYYGKDKEKVFRTISWLITRLCRIKEIKRIRYITSHPKDMRDEKIFLTHFKEKKLMPFIHLPAQSGSDKILRSMNRKYSIKFYLHIINKFKKTNPKIEFSSDFIIGYPGENEDDFKKTINLINKVKYAKCFFFKYSNRKGTTSAILSNQIDNVKKDKRINKIKEIVKKMQKRFNKKFKYNNMNVMFEKKGKYKNQFIGKTEYLQSVIVKSNHNLIGKIKNIYIEKVGVNSMYGRTKPKKKIVFQEE